MGSGESVAEEVKWELGILTFGDFHRWRGSYLTLP